MSRSMLYPVYTGQVMTSSAKLGIVNMANVNGVSSQPQPGWQTWLACLVKLFLLSVNAKQSQNVLWDIQIPNSLLSTKQYPTYYH